MNFGKDSLATPCRLWHNFLSFRTVLVSRRFLFGVCGMYLWIRQKQSLLAWGLQSSARKPGNGQEDFQHWWAAEADETGWCGKDASVGVNMWYRSPHQGGDVWAGTRMTQRSQPENARGTASGKCQGFQAGVRLPPSRAREKTRGLKCHERQRVEGSEEWKSWRSQAKEGNWRLCSVCIHSKVLVPSSPTALPLWLVIVGTMWVSHPEPLTSFRTVGVCGCCLQYSYASSSQFSVLEDAPQAPGVCFPGRQLRPSSGSLN